MEPMVISHYGRGMVKVVHGVLVVVFNPMGDGAGLKPVKFGADLALISLNDPAYNGVANVSRGERVPFVIDGAGEYEVSGVFVQGWATPGPAGRINTVYALTFDGLKLVHLGALTAPELSPAVVEGLGEIDVLFIPVRLAKTDLEAKLVIPVEFEDDDLKKFLKEWGGESRSPVESLALKRKDLSDKADQVAVIKSY